MNELRKSDAPATDTSWFTDILLNQPNDYAGRSTRRRARWVTQRWVAFSGMVLLAALGLSLSAVAMQVRQTRPTVESTRIELKDRAAALANRAEDWESTNASIRQNNQDLLALVVPDLDGKLAEDFTRTAESGGYARAVGGGLVVKLTNPQKVSGQNRVLDSDLQVLVNGLFAAEAKGVSINGMRITATSSIRWAAGSILIDFQPVTSPYKVRAVGQNLKSKLRSTPAQYWLDDLTVSYGIDIQYTLKRRLVLPAGRMPQVSFAERITQ